MTTTLVPDLAQGDFKVTVLSSDREWLAQIADEPGGNVILTVEPRMQDYLQQGRIDSADVF